MDPPLTVDTNDDGVGKVDHADDEDQACYCFRHHYTCPPGYGLDWSTSRYHLPASLSMGQTKNLMVMSKVKYHTLGCLIVAHCSSPAKVVLYLVPHAAYWAQFYYCYYHYLYTAQRFRLLLAKVLTHSVASFLDDVPVIARIMPLIACRSE